MCVTSINLFNLSATQFLYLQNGDDFTYYIGFPWRLHLMTFIKCSMQCWVQYTSSINGNLDFFRVMYLMPQRCGALPGACFGQRNAVGNDSPWILSFGFKSIVCFCLLLGSRYSSSQVPWAPEWEQSASRWLELDLKSGAKPRRRQLKTAEC